MLDGDIEKKLIELHFDLTSNEVLRIPASNEIESLCEMIGSLNSKIPDLEYVDNIFDVYIKNESLESEGLTIEQIEKLIIEWINLVRNSEKTIFENKILEINRIEEKKSTLIEKLENEFSKIRNMAEKLLIFDAVEKDWYSELNEIKIA